MNKTIKINFSDFSIGFNKKNNFIYNELIKLFEVEISENPDILFFSCYGMKYLLYNNCKKVFWTGENMRPDFDGADYCITFDYNEHPNHYRFPLWTLCIDEDELTKIPTGDEIQNIIKTKTKFCAMLVSYCRARKRKKIFKYINSNYKKIDSGGKCLNNMGNKKVDNVLDFFAPYKFSFCFENSSYPGYATEKIINAIKSNCVPIYWGDETLKNEINPKKYISLHHFNSEKEFLNYIIEVDNNDELYKSFLLAPILIDGKIPESYKKENFRNFLIKIVEDKKPNRNRVQKLKHIPTNYFIKFTWDRTIGFN